MNIHSISNTEAQISIAEIFLANGKFEEARAEYQAARDVHKKLVEQFPTVLVYQIYLGGNYCNYGNLIRNEGKPAGSLEWFELAMTLDGSEDTLAEAADAYQQAIKAAPEWIEAQINLRDVCGLTPEEAREVKLWTARTLLQSALSEIEEPEAGPLPQPLP